MGRTIIIFKWKYRTKKLSYISKFIHNKFTTAIESEFIIYDIDLQRWTLQILQEKIGNLNPTIYLKHFIVGYQHLKSSTELFREKLRNL